MSSGKDETVAAATNDVIIALQRNACNFLVNWDLTRTYPASLASRKEGFTEEWGSNIDADDSNPVQGPSSSFTSTPATCPVRLVQYRPAWLEQLVLRIGSIPHVVFNASYAVVEATGPLPYLQVLQPINATTTRMSRKISSSSDRGAVTNRPAMVGRHSLGAASAGNAILDYLKEFGGVDLDADLTIPQRQQAVLYMSLLRDTLQPCLTVLRYQADDHAWEQIYKPQCLRAGSAVGSGDSWVTWGWASWQAWCERVHAISSLGRSQRSHSVETAVHEARKAYAVLDERLQRSTYLLDTNQPCIVDCILWDHLMQALSDIYLVVVLADYPALLRFTQHIWNTYQFGSGVDSCTNVAAAAAAAAAIPSLSVWNLEENLSNAFNSTPLSLQSCAADGDSRRERYQTALQMMQELALVQQDLSETLLLAKKHREHSSTLPKPRPFATWHRWRMGDSYFSKASNGTDSHHKDGSGGGGGNNTVGTEELVRREYQRNDEIWLASVAATTLALFLTFGLAGGQR
jgi:glutathione S-transferase